MTFVGEQDGRLYFATAADSPKLSQPINGELTRTRVA